MTRNHEFLPSDVVGGSRLETRLVLSHALAGHLPVPAIAAAVHHHVAPSHVKVVHHKAVHHGAKAGSKSTGPASLSVMTTPIIVLPISAPTAASTPTSPTESGSSTGTLPIPTVSGVMSANEQTIVDLVNQQRAEAGLAPLQVSSQLVQAAQIQSTDMAELGEMEHDLPGAALPALQDRAQYVGYNYSYMGENIAFNFPDDNSVMTGWMNSPDHRANILDANYTQIGVGIAYDSQGEPYYTQDFGQPG